MFGKKKLGMRFGKTRFGKRGWNNSNNWVGYIALFYWAGSGRPLGRPTNI